MTRRVAGSSCYARLMETCGWSSGRSAPAPRSDCPSKPTIWRLRPGERTCGRETESEGACFPILTANGHECQRITPRSGLDYTPPRTKKHPSSGDRVGSDPETPDLVHGDDRFLRKTPPDVRACGSVAGNPGRTQHSP